MVEVVTQAQSEAAGEEEVVAPVELKEVDTVTEEPVIQEEKEWDDMLDEGDEETSPAEEAEVPEEKEEEVAPEEVPPEEEVTTEEVEETSPEEELKEEVPEVPVPENAPEPEDTRTPEQVQQELTQARENARDNLVDKFTWTEEQAEMFSEDPGAVLSELAADMFLDLFDSISQGLRGQMPGMVHGILQQQKAQVNYDQQFYNAWPQLAKSEHKETVDRISAAYHQQNPGVTLEKAQQEIGVQAWVALRLPLDQLLAQTQGQEKVVEAPVIHPSAHVPASAGNTTQLAKAPVQAPQNDFEQLADEFLQDDEQG